jgi:hypothetical protein
MSERRHTRPIRQPARPLLHDSMEVPVPGSFPFDPPPPPDFRSGWGTWIVIVAVLCFSALAVAYILTT